MQWLIILVLLLAPSMAQAFNRCEIDGRTVYQSQPCPGEVVVPPPPVEPSSGQSRTPTGPPEPQRPLTWEEHCGQISDLAETIMRGRQSGASMQDMMSGAPNDLIRQIVIDAYNQPRYSTQRYQSRVISEFSNRTYLVCIQADR